MDTLSVIIPCFNEESSLKETYSALNSVIDWLPVNREIIFVDDGSTDNTLGILKELSLEMPCVHYISFSRNFGKEAAIYAGLKTAKGNLVALMDADMQDPPELLIKMYSVISNGEFDCVAARRDNRKGEPIIRSLFAKAFYSIINSISDVEIVSGARDFRLMTRVMVDAVLRVSEVNRFSKGIFAWVGFKTKWISYENIERNFGKTKWKFSGLFKYGLDAVISFSDIPLTMASWFGIMITMISFVLLVVVVIRRIIFGDPVAGWASTICVIMFIGGLQAFFMGIIGHYLAKTYKEVKHRPIYIIAEHDDMCKEIH